MSIANDKIVNLQDAKVLYDDLRGRIAETNAYEKSITESSAIQSFDDGANWPMKLNVAVDPVQDLHGYDHPWPGGGGKNKCPVAASGTYNGIVLTNNIDGSITLTGTNTSSATYIDCFPGTFDSTVYAGYVFSYGDYSGNTGSVQVMISGSDRTALQNHNSGETIITDNGTGLYLSIRIAALYAIPSGGITLYPMLREPSATSDWEPYSNVCPITGWTGANVTVTGKNLLDPNLSYVSGYWGTDGNRVSSNNYVCELEFVNVKQETNYTVQMNKTASTHGAISLCEYDANKEFIGYTIVIPTTAPSTGIVSGTFLTNENTKYIRISVPIANVNNIQFEEGTVATAYEPFGTTYHITFPTSAGTVYGGNLTVNKDGTGTLVVDRAFFEFDGSEDEQIATGTYGGSNKYVSFSLSGEIYKNRIEASSISNAYLEKDISGANTNIGFAVYNHRQLRCRYKLDNSITSEIARAYFASNPVQFVVPLLDNSVTSYVLTPGQVLSLIGKNHVWADCGDILSLTYNSKQGLEFIREDTAGQIAEVNAVLKAIIAPELDGMVADTALAVNDFRIVDGVLYIVTSPIAAGGTLTVGTNVSKTSIGEQITALLNAN